MVAGAIEDHSVEQTLDAVDGLYSRRNDADASMFELAAHFADLHAGDSLPRSRGVLPGMERSVRVGGEGTPRIAEFAYAELGARMRMGAWAARNYVADVLDLRHRLPLIWQRVRAREARISNARLVAARTRHLSPEAAAYVDAAMADLVDGSLPWGRFERRLDGKIVAADPEMAAAREERRVSEQFAKRTRASENGTAGFYIRSTIGVIARVDASVSFLAQALKAFGDTEDLDRRRVKAVALLCNPAKAVELLAAFAALRSSAVGDLADDPALDLDDEPRPTDDPDTNTDEGSSEDDHHARCPQMGVLDRMDAFVRRVGFSPTHLPPWLTARADVGVDAGAYSPRFVVDWSTLLPSLTLNLHIAHADLVGGRGGVVRWEGEGPLTHQFVHSHLRPLHRYRIQPVIDLDGMAPVDAYETPDRHRKAVHLRTPADASPYSSNLSPDVDLDHTEECDAALATGPETHWSTRLANLAPLGRFHHRVKTHGHWTVRQPFHGIVVWRDPHGQIYLVDHTGTHKVTGQGTSVGPATTYDPGLELHPADVVVEIDFHHAG